MTAKLTTTHVRALETWADGEWRPDPGPTEPWNAEVLLRAGQLAFRDRGAFRPLYQITPAGIAALAAHKEASHD